MPASNRKSSSSGSSSLGGEPVSHRNLANLVRRLDLARRTSPNPKLRTYAGKRWERVCVFEIDGARYVVLRQSNPAGSSAESLTNGERRVLVLAAEGLRTKEIAYLLGKSDVTVRVLLMRAARKYDVRGRGELLAKWVDALGAESVLTGRKSATACPPREPARFTSLRWRAGDQER